MADERVEMSVAEYNKAIEMAVMRAKVDSMNAAFEAHEKQEDKFIKDIFVKLELLQKEITQWPLHLNECSSKIENKLHVHMKDKYMTVDDANLLEQKLENSIKSFKIWIVSSVGGFSTAAVFILYVFKLLEGMPK